MSGGEYILLFVPASHSHDFGPTVVSSERGGDAWNMVFGLTPVESAKKWSCFMQSGVNGEFLARILLTASYLHNGQAWFAQRAL